MADAAARKRKEREARQEAGLIRVEIWAHRDDAEEIRELARRLLEKRKDA